jgi:hypothetical protein
LVRRFTGVMESLGSGGLGSKAKERKSNRCGQSYATSGGGAGLAIGFGGRANFIQSDRLRQDGSPAADSRRRVVPSRTSRLSLSMT